MQLFDAHNHLQDGRFGGRQAELLATAAQTGVSRMVVNGSCESDWPLVAELARQHAAVIPSFGYHPWYVHERSSRWQEELLRRLDETPGAAIGEAGLDCWKPGLSYEGQEEVFVWQLRLAAERNVAISIHCLQAWGKLFEALRAQPRPRRGFLLHSYGGPAEMVAPLAKLGAYFSFPGCFAHERKAKRREAFKQVPEDRLLIETDAPDQLPPDEWNQFSLQNPLDGQPLNHPANLAAVYQYVAEMLAEPLASVAAHVEKNFQRLFLEP